MGYPVVWFDLGAADVAPLQKFYGELFGWKLEGAAETYTMIDTQGGAGMIGGIGRSGTGDPWLAFYVECDDPQSLLDKAESMGAKTVVPLTELPAVTFAMFSDPDGLLIGLMKPIPDAPGPSAGDGEAVDYFEILGSDAARTQAFYRELFGWKVDEDARYSMVDTGAGRGAAGGIGASGQGINWATVYARVDDVSRYLSRVEGLGGRVEHGPMDVGQGTTTGMFYDPIGNPFGIYHYRES